MNSIEVLSTLQKLGMQVFSTGDAAGALQLTHAGASKYLSRLRDAGQMISISRSYWTLNKQLDPLLIPEQIVAPWPSYISLQSALFYRGLLSQIPRAVTAVTLSRAQRVRTPFGEIVFRHLPKELFFGFEVEGKFNLKIATPEKALVDLLYLGLTPRNRLAKLPEIEFSRAISRKRVQEIIARIPSRVRRIKVLERFQDLI